MHAVINDDRRMHELPYSGPTCDEIADVWKLLKNFEVIEKRIPEAFRRIGKNSSRNTRESLRSLSALFL
jgi:hypothetical protein